MNPGAFNALMGSLLVAAPEAQNIPLESLSTSSSTSTNASATPAPPPLPRVVDGVPQDYSGATSQANSISNAGVVIEDTLDKKNVDVANSIGTIRGAQNTADKAVGTAIDKTGKSAEKDAEITGNEFSRMISAENQRDIEFGTRYEKRMKQAQDKFDDALHANKNFENTKVYNWWSQASTGAQILGIISQTLSGALQGATGNAGGDTPLDRIIKLDLERQVTGIKQKGQIAENARGAYKDILAQAGDETSAYLQLSNAAWASVEKRIRAQIAASPEAQRATLEKNAANLLAEAATKRAENISKLETHFMDSARQDATAESGLALHLGTAADADRRSQDANENARLKAAKDQRGLGSDGWDGTARSEKEAIALRTAEHEGAGLRKDFTRLAQLVHEGRINEFTIAEQQQLAARINSVLKGEHHLNMGAAMNASEGAILTSVAGTSKFTNYILNKVGEQGLLNARNSLIRSHVMKLKEHGIVPNAQNQFITKADYDEYSKAAE